MSKRYSLDTLDMEMLLCVHEELYRRIGNDATSALLQSSFLSRLEEDPEYIGHFDAAYWADYVIGCNSKKNK